MNNAAKSTDCIEQLNGVVSILGGKGSKIILHDDNAPIQLANDPEVSIWGDAKSIYMLFLAPKDTSIKKVSDHYWKQFVRPIVCTGKQIVDWMSSAMNGNKIAFIDDLG